MLGAEMPRNLPRIGEFAVVIFLEADRECFDRLWHHRTHQPYYHTRINSTAQECTQWHLAHETNLHSIFQQCMCTFNSCCFIILARRCEGEIPIAFRADLPIFVDQDVASEELHDVFEDGVRCGYIAIHQVFIEGDEIDFARNTSFKDGFNFGTKDQPLTIPVVIQRLLTEAVTCSQEALPFVVPKSEGEHTA